MEVEQIIKQLDWLEEERRKDKTKISSLEEKLAAIEGNIPILANQFKDLSGEITRLEALLGRIDHLEESLLQNRIENKKSGEEIERQIKKRDEEIDKVHRVEIRAIDSSIAEIRKDLDSISEVKRSLKSRVDEEIRLAKLIDELRARIDSNRRAEEEYTRTYRLLDDGRRQDTKRMTDLQGEVTAIRKRLDEQRGRVELLVNSTKKNETRLNELSQIDSERQATLENFLERQALFQVERDRIWKEWESRFATIETQTADVENNLQVLDATHRAVKRTQQAVDEITQKLERRINEITEIQRLAEERFRQEWITFKSDDQKRWTNYTLTIDEQKNESQRQYNRLTEKVTLVENTMQELDDLLSEVTEQSEKQLQTLLAMTHEWVTAYERTVGRSRK